MILKQQSRNLLVHHEIVRSIGKHSSGIVIGPHKLHLLFGVSVALFLDPSLIVYPYSPITRLSHTSSFHATNEILLNSLRKHKAHNVSRLAPTCFCGWPPDCSRNFPSAQSVLKLSRWTVFAAQRVPSAGGCLRDTDSFGFFSQYIALQFVSGPMSQDI
jgi:hypothetical protein